MAAPSIEATRKAAAAVQGMAAQEINRRQSAEMGDTLVALFTVLARKVFPSDAESTTVQRVRLMMAAWILRAELEPHKVSPPDEATARKAVDAVAVLNGAALDARIGSEVGDNVMAFFPALANRVMPEQGTAALAGKVHLMVLAYLLRGDLARRR